MSEIHISEFFRKDISTTNSFLVDIWHPLTNIDDKDELYRKYSSSREFHFINDFVNNRSYIASDLSYQNIKKIHINNARNSDFTSRKQVVKRTPDAGIGCGYFATKENGFNFDHQSSHDHEAIKYPSKPWTPDELITDDFLDKIQIPQGERRRRQAKFYMQSRVLFIYLSYHIGSERIVNIRRKVLDKKYPNDFGALIMQASGSKAEGLDMKGSDTDLMITFIHASENDDWKRDELSFRYDSLKSDMKPGYVIVEDSEDGKSTVLSSCQLKNQFLRFVPYLKSAVMMTIHGPAMSSSSCGDDLDVVPCLKSQHWPKIAKEWICRKRKFGWPSEEMIRNISKQGCHIVPIGSSTNHQNESEWRLSFSLAEKELIYTFNHTQILIYGLLKIMLKEIVNKQPDVSDLLCSYFLKTTLFWVIEETHQSVWDHKYMIMCFHLCLERLVQFIICDNCPNYFVPVNNMFSGRFSHSGKEKLLQTLCDISGSGLEWVLQSTTMCNLKSYIKDLNTALDLKISQRQKEKRDIAGLALDLTRHSKLMIGQLFSLKCIFLKSCVKSFLKIPIVRNAAFGHFSHFIDTNATMMKNKTLYVVRKLRANFLYMGCKADLVSGKAILATWLYNQGKFHECLQVTEMAFDCLQFRVIHANMRKITMWPNNKTISIDYLSRLDLIKCLHYCCTMNVQCLAKSDLILKELSRLAQISIGFLPVTEYIRTNVMEMTIFPDTYCYFMKFLCHFRLGNTEYCNEALENMHRVHFIGSEDETIIHNGTLSILRLIGNMVKNRTENDWENDTKSFTDLIQSVLPCDFNEFDSSNIDSLLGNVQNFGFDTDFIRNCILLPQKIFQT